MEKVNDIQIILLGLKVSEKCSSIASLLLTVACIFFPFKYNSVLGTNRPTSIMFSSNVDMDLSILEM